MYCKNLIGERKGEGGGGGGMKVFLFFIIFFFNVFYNANEFNKTFYHFTTVL